MTEVVSVSDALAERLRAARKKQCLTIVQLAERCAINGADHLTVPALTNMERQGEARANRKITVEEWLILAAVIGVQPLDLIFPESGGTVLIPGLGQVTSRELAAWIADRKPVAETVLTIRVPAGAKITTHTETT